MEHGKDHDQRSAHVRQKFHQRTPPEDPIEANIDERHAGANHGAEPAPTRKAAEREAERHRREREELGVHAAGTDGHARQERPDDVSRQDLDELQREVDDEALKRA